MAVDPAKPEEILRALGALLQRDTKMRFAARKEALKRASRFHAWNRMGQTVAEMIDGIVE